MKSNPPVIRICFPAKTFSCSTVVPHSFGKLEDRSELATPFIKIRYLGGRILPKHELPPQMENVDPRFEQAPQVEEL